MTLFLIPSLYALFLWWFSTGVIVYLDGLPRSTFDVSFAFLSLLLFLALAGLVASRADMSVSGVYLAFSCAVVIWGWQVASFYMGLITGPRPVACPAGVRGWPRFWYALQACLYHELVSLAGALVLLAVCWNSPNQIGLHTYLLLWGLHQCAKLNVFLGARNLNEEFLPEHMKYLASYFSLRPINRFFPFAISAATVATVLIWLRAFTPGLNQAEVVAASLLGCMAVLGVFELWLLVVPLPVRLWDWSLRSHRPPEHTGPVVPGVERIP